MRTDQPLSLGKPIKGSQKVDPQPVIDKYLALFEEKNGSSTVPAVTYEKGWFVFRYNRMLFIDSRYRLADMERMIKTLSGRPTKVIEIDETLFRFRETGR